MTLGMALVRAGRRAARSGLARRDGGQSPAAAHLMALPMPPTRPLWNANTFCIAQIPQK